LKNFGERENNQPVIIKATKTNKKKLRSLFFTVERIILFYQIKNKIKSPREKLSGAGGNKKADFL